MILVKIYWNPLGKADIDHEVFRLCNCKTSCRENVRSGIIGNRTSPRSDNKFHDFKVTSGKKTEKNRLLHPPTVRSDVWSKHFWHIFLGICRSR
ncbi:hypothetical protein ABFA07_010151 [Porites harrisoni]